MIDLHAFLSVSEMAFRLASAAILLAELVGLLHIIRSSECHEATWLSTSWVNGQSGFVKLFEFHPIGTILHR